MNCDNVIHYIRKVLENSHIPSAIYEEPYENIELLDMGLRETLIIDFDKVKLFQHFVQKCKPQTLYYFTDIYSCSYVCLMLPNTEKTQYLIFGPFTYIEINHKNYMQLLKDLEVPSSLLPFVENYYYNVPFVRSETQLKNLMSTMAEMLWNGNNNYSIAVIKECLYHNASTEKFIKDPDQLDYLMPLNANVIEARYAYENRCMQTVRQGNVTAIDQLLTNNDGMNPVPPFTNSLRDYKNYLVVFNTLLRKAAEQGAVHPVYLEQLSAKYIKTIEALTVIPDHKLERDMLYKYCLLVRNYSVRGYSPILQKVINQINLNLTSDLGLKQLSEMFNISAGYLSTLFKKETGTTLTDYVNKKRIERAISLLNTTTLQIQNIASYCGFQDINYFTRIFKKFNGMTPTAYKELISKSTHEHQL